jgi:tetratricopeptide (TPR) repeat protein
MSEQSKKDLLEQVKALKDRARAYRDFDEPDEAAKMYGETIKLLQPEEKLAQERLETARSEQNTEGDGSTTPTRYELQVAEELADCHGSRGGALRRMGSLDEAIREYDLGYALETNRHYKMISTYNTINRIVVRVLRAPAWLHDPGQLTDDERKAVGDSGARGELKAAMHRLEARFKELKEQQKKDPWALADLVMIKALQNDEADAKMALKKLKDSKPPNKCYESALGTMRDIAKLELPQVELIRSIRDRYEERVKSTE